MDSSATNGRNGTYENGAGGISNSWLEVVYNAAYYMLPHEGDAVQTSSQVLRTCSLDFSALKEPASAGYVFLHSVVHACIARLNLHKDSPGFLRKPGLSHGPGASRDATSPEDVQGAIERGIRMLAPELRAAIVLRDVIGLSSQIGAEVLEVSLETFKAWVHNARVILMTLRSAALPDDASVNHVDTRDPSPQRA